MNQFRPYINRLVKQKEMQITNTYHDLNMKKMKPITTKLMQHAETITINRSKREKLREVRDIEIERQNKILLNKIETVISKKGKYSVVGTKKNRTRGSSSLNQMFRKQQLESIQQQNQQLFQRLHKQRATLNNTKLEKDWQQKKKIIKKMANLEYNTIHFKEKELRSIKTERILLPILGNIKLSKVKVIDGYKMLIKVEVNDECVRIIGDFCDNKDLKIIQIPKEKAIVIIQSKYRGKIQNLIDRLNYDHTSQTLHLTIQEQVRSKQKMRLNKTTHQFNPSSTHRINKSNLDRINETTRQQFNQTVGQIKNTNKFKINSETLLKIDPINNRQEQNYEQEHFQDNLPDEQKKKDASIINKQKQEQNYNEDFEQGQPNSK